MSDNTWSAATLGSCVSILSGGTPSKSNPSFWNGSVPWVTAKDMKVLRLHDTEDHVSEEAILSGTRVVEAGVPLVLVRGMTLHHDVPIVTPTVPMAFNQDVKALVPHSAVQSQFLTYWLLAHRDVLLGLVDSASHGTGRINTNQLASLPLRLPPQDEQRAIAGVLGALDDKIELNRRMNETLDRLAELQFARLNAEAPTTWPDASIADLADYINGRNFTKDASGTGRMVIRIAELNSGPGPSTVYANTAAPDEHIARADDILFAWSGSLGVYRWRGAEALVNQHIFKVIPRVPAWFVYRHLRRAMPDFREIAADKATTMGHIKRGHLAGVTLKLPPAAVLDDVSALIEPLDQKIAANDAESRTLADLRDALLPKLISGELRVRDLEGLGHSAAH